MAVKIITHTAPRTRALESVPVDSALLTSANWWFDVSWYGLLIAGTITTIGAAATVVFLFVQFWSSGVKERQTEWRTSSLEQQTAQAKKDTALAQEKIAGLNKETARLSSEAESARAAIAGANARAAEATQKANEADLARLKLEAKLAPRSLGPAKQAQLTTALKSILTGITVDLVVFESLGPDVAPLSHEIQKVLVDAGVVVRILTPLPGGVFATGVLVRAEADSPPNVMGAVGPTANALREVGLDAGPWEPFPKGEPPAGAYNGPGGPNSNFRILIGGKPQPL